MLQHWMQPCAGRRASPAAWPMAMCTCGKPAASTARDVALTTGPDHSLPTCTVSPFNLSVATWAEDGACKESSCSARRRATSVLFLQWIHQHAAVAGCSSHRVAFSGEPRSNVFA